MSGCLFVGVYKTKKMNFPGSLGQYEKTFFFGAAHAPGG